MLQTMMTVRRANTTTPATAHRAIMAGLAKKQARRNGNVIHHLQSKSLLHEHW